MKVAHMSARHCHSHTADSVLQSMIVHSFCACGFLLYALHCIVLSEVYKTYIVGLTNILPEWNFFLSGGPTVF